MNRQPSLHELSLALPPRERVILLEKIKKNINIQRSHQDLSVYHRIDDTEQRKQLLHSELVKMSIWDKFILWLQRVFTSKTKEELISNRIMVKSIQKLSHAPYSIIDSDGLIIKTTFATALLDLYKSIVVPTGIIRFFWENPTHLQSILSLSLGNRIQGSKHRLFDFIPFPDLVNLYAEKGNKGDLKNSVLDALNSYLMTIPDEVYLHIQEGILPIYWLQELSFYDFGKVFSLFQVTLESIGDTEKPPFKAASLTQLAAMINGLAFALYVGGKIGAKTGIHEEVIRYYISIATENQIVIQDEGDIESSIRVPSREELTAIPAETVKELNQELEKFPAAIHGFTKKVPLVDLLKVAHKDPFYRFIAYSPAPNIKEYYSNALKLKILQELDNHFTLIRLDLIKRYKEILFVNGMKTLQYFIQESVQIKNAGFPLFAYLEPITTLYSYLHQIFVPMYSELLRSVSRIVPERMREVHNSFILQTGTLEDMMMQIERIDDQYNPVSQDGKIFYRTRTAALRDLNQQKAFRSMVMQRDKDLKDILDRSIEAISGLISALEEVISTNIESIKAELSRHHDPVTGRPAREIMKILLTRLSLLKKTLHLEESLGEEASNQSILRETKR